MNRILVVGHGRAGKDVSAMILSGITKIPYGGSTSWQAKDSVADALGIHPMVAWETRHENREFWKRHCDDLRAKMGQTYLIQRALDSTHRLREGIVTGIRDKIEIDAVRSEKVVDCILWIERPGIPADPTVTFTSADADEIILNDGNLVKLNSTLFTWAEKHGLVPGLYLSGRCPTTDRYRD